MFPSDLRAATRAILRAPRTAAAAVLCIALGSAAVTAVLSLLWATLLRPLPFPDADRLVRVWIDSPAQGERGEPSYADIEDLRTLRAFDRVEATARARLVITGRDGARRTEGEAVTAGYFDMVGARAELGRLFTRDEYDDGASRVVLLSHAAWGSLFGYARDAIGATIETSSGTRTVVGVLDTSFSGTIEEDSGDLEFWIPIRQWIEPAARSDRNFAGTWILARLAPERTIVQARTEAQTLGERLAALHPLQRGDATFEVEPLSENWRAGLRRGTWLLVAAAGLLLVVAAVNVAGLLLARAVSRRRELAVRTALGASPGRITRLLLLEALMIAAVGGAIGIASGPAIFGLFHRLAPVDIPAYVPLGADPATSIMAAAVLALTAVLAGIAPARIATRGDTVSTLREAGRGSTPGIRERRWGNALVIAEVATTVVLLASAGLLLRSYRALGDADLGFRTERLLRVGLFADIEGEDALRSLHARARERLLRVDEIENAAMVWPTVPMWAAVRVPVHFAGMPEDSRTRGYAVSWYRTDDEFFDLAGIPLLAGRAFDARDAADAAPVAVVSASLAERMGGASRALGATVDFDGTSYRVIGVAEDAVFTTARAPRSEHEVLYTSIVQLPPAGVVSFVMRTRTPDPAHALPAVRAALAEVAPRAVLDWTDPVERALGDRYVTDRFLVALTGAFAAAALVLAAVGLFAVLAHVVARTRSEFGVRRALGATRARIVRGVVGRAVRTVGIGLAVGLGAALIASRALSGVLFGIGRFDAWSYAATAAVLLTTAVVAAAWPAARAASVAPAEALRSD